MTAPIQFDSLGRRSRHYKPWTFEELIAKARRWNRIHGRAPTEQDWRHLKARGYAPGEWPSHCAVRYVFGTWMEFLDACGLPPARNGWNRERVIQALVRFHAEFGRMPISTDFRRALPGYPTNKTIYTYLGGWGPAARAAWARVADLQRIGNSNAAA